MAPMWMGLSARPSATSLPVEETDRSRPPPTRISAHGSMVSVPEMVVLRGTRCGLAAAVQVSVLTVPGWLVGPAVGAGQAAGTPLSAGVVAGESDPQARA